MAPQLVNAAYWLALSLWFGGSALLLLAVPGVLATVRDADPTLPGAINVDLEGQHAALLGGGVLEALRAVLLRAALPCAVAVAATLAAEWVLLLRGGDAGPALLSQGIKTALFVAASGVLVYDWRFVGPKAAAARAAVMTAIRRPEGLDAARDGFERAHAESLLALQVGVAVLLGLVLFSGFALRPF